MSAQSSNFEAVATLLAKAKTDDSIDDVNLTMSDMIQLASEAVKSGDVVITEFNFKAKSKKSELNTVDDINAAIKALPDGNNGVSDGYHTFKDLYEHRSILYIALCVSLNWKNVWKSRVNSDGSVWGDSFALGLGKDLTCGTMISYHLNIKYWDQCKCEELAIGLYDGHTSHDVLDRLERSVQKFNSDS